MPTSWCTSFKTFFSLSQRNLQPPSGLLYLLLPTPLYYWAGLCLVDLSGPTLCDPMFCNPPGSSVDGTSQRRILEWVSISFSGGSSRPRDWTSISSVSCIGRWFPHYWATWEARCWLVGMNILGWPKGLFEFFHNILQKNLNELFWPTQYFLFLGICLFWKFNINRIFCVLFWLDSFT